MFKKKIKSCFTSPREKVLCDLRNKITAQINQVTIYSETCEPLKHQTQEFCLNQDGWSEYQDFNVQAILCDLNNPDRGITVINCVFNKGGYIPPMSQDRTKSIFIIDGSVTDTVNNKTFKGGEVYTLEPGTIHSLKSDDCLLTITWKPAFK